MRWQVKAALMDLFSVSPCRDRLHYWAQRNVTKSLPRSETEFREKFGLAKKHLGALTRHGSTAVSRLRFYEFGTGWDLAIPFCLCALGVKSQVVVDISKLAHIDLIDDTLRKISRLQAETAAGNMDAGPIPREQRKAWVAFLERKYGIRYVAPCDARATPLETGSVDCITSTDTLEHIPEEDIHLILRECRRILRRDGVLSFVIDYQDHYSYCDPRITAYNFLRYSPSAWRWFNPRLQYQNRLRHKDYVRLAGEEGLEAVEGECGAVLPKDLADLEQLDVASSFSEGYPPEELAVRRGHLILRPASS